jgi:hypothetical protein
MVWRSVPPKALTRGLITTGSPADGVGRTADGRRVYFVLPEAPYGGPAEKSLARAEHCLAIPDGLDDTTAPAPEDVS